MATTDVTRLVYYLCRWWSFSRWCITTWSLTNIPTNLLIVSGFPYLILFLHNSVHQHFYDSLPNETWSSTYFTTPTNVHMHRQKRVHRRSHPVPTILSFDFEFLRTSHLSKIHPFVMFFTISTNNRHPTHPLEKKIIKEQGSCY